MTVPFEGAEVLHLTLEQQQAADFAAFYVAEVEGGAVNVFIPDGMFRRAEEPVAEPDEQNPEDK